MANEKTEIVGTGCFVFIINALLALAVVIAVGLAGTWLWNGITITPEITWLDGIRAAFLLYGISILTTVYMEANK